MKRPLAVIGFPYLAVCALAAGLPGRVWAALAVVLGLCGVLAALSRHRARGYAVCVLLAAGCACAGLLLADTLYLAPARAVAGTERALSGTVTDIKSAKSIVVRDVDGFSIAVSAREPLDVRVGEQLSAHVALSLYEEGDDSRGAAVRARQTPLRAFVLGEYRAAPPEPGTAASVLYGLRLRFEDVLLTRFSPENAGLFSAMLLGERQFVTDAVSDAWYGAGIGHLLAISGYHITLLSSLSFALLSMLRLPRRVCALLSCGVVLGYMALVGFSPGVARAGTMTVLFLLASVLGREADALTSLSVAGLVICVPAPLAASGASFALSFLAALGLILFARPLEAWLTERLGTARFPRVRGFFVSALAAALCGYGATLPVALLMFDRIPLYGPAANVLLAPLVPPAIVCGLLAMLLGALPVVGFLAAPFAFVADAACTLITEAARVISGLPFAQPPAGAGFLRVWMLGAAVLIAAALLRPSRRKTRACALLCAVTLMVGVLSYQLVMRGAVRLTVVSTTGAAAFVAVKDGRAAIVGDVRTPADAYAVRRVLARQSVRGVELVALLPVSGDRTGAVSALLLDYDVSAAVLGEGDRADARMEAALEGAAIYRWEDTAQVELLGGERLRLSPDGVFAEFAGIKAFILTENCDILNSIMREGRPTVAAIGEKRPTDARRLWSRWLLDCGGSGAGFIAQETLALEDGSAAEFLCRDGKARLLE